ncbi:hypothetical protein Kim5_PA00297 (plasmid) [Rhizobium sp. Kim5]|nr:hypothetical protein Kim5_PA00297 [Rhizobium sp. Kim5]
MSSEALSSPILQHLSPISELIRHLFFYIAFHDVHSSTINSGSNVFEFISAVERG